MPHDIVEEDFRLRTNHLSYRYFYLPWSRHAAAVLISEFVVFWVVVLITFRLVASRDRSSLSGADGPGPLREVIDGS
jgi:hypothetical protein